MIEMIKQILEFASEEKIYPTDEEIDKFGKEIDEYLKPKISMYRKKLMTDKIMLHIATKFDKCIKDFLKKSSFVRPIPEAGKKEGE